MQRENLNVVCFHYFNNFLADVSLEDREVWLGRRRTRTVKSFRELEKNSGEGERTKVGFWSWLFSFLSLFFLYLFAFSVLLFFLFCLFVCYQFYQFFSCLLICLFLTLFSFERTVLKVSVLTAQGSEGSYDEDSRWAGGQVPCLHMAGESASADHL